MKIGLIYSFKESNWFSVTKIVDNLLKSYQLDRDSVEFVHINYSPYDTQEENFDAATEALKKNLNKLVFLDHRPHPIGFLNCIKPIHKENLDEIIIHIFGDFTLNFRWWSATEKMLKDIKVKFICASEKQAKLVNKFVKSDSVYVCPFPVDVDEFRFDQDRAMDVRKKLGFSKDDFIFLYTGRLSEQKKSKELVQTFLNLKLEKKLPKNCKLLLAGKFDNLGTPYLQENQLLGEYFRKTNHVLETYPKEVVEDVLFVGDIPNLELVDYYNSCDRFVSFSCYHDEDYGMSVAEALSCGLPCLLTNWAGYSSFKIDSMPGSTIHIPVSLGEKRVSFDEAYAREQLIKCYSEPLSSEQRAKLAKEASKFLSVRACGEKLKQINDSEVEDFGEFDDFLHLLGAVNEFKDFPFMNDGSKVFNEFYFKVYDVYAE